MQTIYKYPMEIKQNQLIDMPKGSTYVLFALQDGKPHLWMLVRTEEPQETRQFSIYGTGHQLYDYCAHMGSLIDGPYVWHLFEEPML